MADVRVTTKDNPYDPFEEFDQWLLYDNEKGYGTCAYLARLAQTSDALSEDENNEEIERAIDEMIKYDFENVGYKKVYRKEAKAS